MLDKNIHIYDQKDELIAVTAHKVKHCGMSVQQLARQSKLAETTIRNLSNGKFVPRLITLLKLSRGMGLDLAQFLYE